MRVSRPVSAARSAATASPVANSASDDGLSAMRVLAAAAHISEPRLVRGPRAGSGNRLAVDPVSFGPTVSGASAGERHAADHVGGAMLPAARDTVALSDGTRISFGAVAEVPDFELA